MSTVTPVEFNAVLDEFKRQDQQWIGLGVVEADLAGIRQYRWMADGRLGVAGASGYTLRPATDQEYTDLEQGIATGRVRITRFNRVSRQTEVIHDPS